MPFPYPRNQVDHQISETELITRKEARLRFRDQIHLAWDYRCAYCNDPLGRSPTLDHVIPKAHGGLTVKENLVSSCWNCNISKGKSPWVDWYRKQPFWSAMNEWAITHWLMGKHDHLAS